MGSQPPPRVGDGLLLPGRVFCSVGVKTHHRKLALLKGTIWPSLGCSQRLRVSPVPGPNMFISPKRNTVPSRATRALAPAPGTRCPTFC